MDTTVYDQTAEFYARLADQVRAILTPQAYAAAVALLERLTLAIEAYEESALAVATRQRIR